MKTSYRPNVARVSVVVLDPQLAPGGQTAWAFTHPADAQAVASFLNTRLGDGDRVAWVESVRLEHTLSERVLQYLDGWAEVAEAFLDDDYEE